MCLRTAAAPTSMYGLRGYREAIRKLRRQTSARMPSVAGTLVPSPAARAAVRMGQWARSRWPRRQEGKGTDIALQVGK